MRKQRLSNGLDSAVGSNRLLKNRNLAILCHTASVDKDLRHILDIGFSPSVIFTPQHGLWAHTQANMIEWEGGYRHPKYNAVIHSLYGKHRKPTAEMLDGVDAIIIDLFDIGARYYTYIWTALLTLEAAEELDIEVIVLDRPNPINGFNVSGPVLDMNYSSFVGLYPLPIRHGLTIGEIMTMVHSQREYKGRLTIVPMKGWERGYFDEYDQPWVMPSPNMPTLDTALVYPGQCLLEATNISEGRGTTRPFELFGAPFIDSADLVKSVTIPGAKLRPASFVPTFDKYAGELVNGAQIHITARDDFDPVHATWEILRFLRKKYPIEWLPPPYEYEYEKLPIEILIGGRKYLDLLENDIPYREAGSEWDMDIKRYLQERELFLLYQKR